MPGSLSSLVISAGLAMSPAQSVPPISPPQAAAAASPVRAPGGYRPAPSDAHDPRALAQRHRGRGIGWAALGIGALLATVTLQSRAVTGRRQCIEASGGHLCLARDGPRRTLLHASGLSLVTVASFGSAFAFGRARAYEDFRAGTSSRGPIAAIVGGTVVISYAQGLLISGLVQHLQRRSCRDAACHRAKQIRGAVLTDLGMLGVAAGVGVIGFGVGRSMQSRRLAHLSVVPTASAREAGMVFSGRF